MTTTRCPFCESDDLVDDGPRTTCVECEANAFDGVWASGRANRRMRAAVAHADRRFESGQATLPAIGIGLAVMLTATFLIAAAGGHLDAWTTTFARLGAAILGG